MKKTNTSLTMLSMFRSMMEEGYYPSFEDNYIQFGIDGNIAVVEYNEGILSVRIFFSFEKEEYDLFLEASNMTMTGTYAVKPVVLDDKENIIFSCELMCDNLREFKKFLPKAIHRLNEALTVHKTEMRKLIIARDLVERTIPATDDSMTGINKSQKILS